MVYARLFILIVCLATVFSQAGFAGYEYKFDSPSAKTGQLESEMTAKVERGITNTLLGWTEILRTPNDWAGNPEHGKFKALTLGVPYGILRAVGRTGVGVYEMVTFFAPQKPIFYPIQGDVV